jgi:signal transduction histidine kinase
MGEALQRAKDQERHFLMSVSHDLRTPLTSIRGYAEAIADGAADDPARAATVIVGESRRLERLVGDLLDLARIDADRFDLSSVPADVVDIVAGTVEGFGPELRDAGLVLHHSLDRAQPVVAVVDVDRLAQVVANLTTNAIDFARTAVWADVHVEAGEACIQISDDGPGIPPASLGRVFDRLYQADNQPTRRGRGTGLGLAIVAELAARMGGRCDVTSVEGRGTTFTVRLPLASR